MMILDDFDDFWCPTERDAVSMPAVVAATIQFEEILVILMILVIFGAPWRGMQEACRRLSRPQYNLRRYWRLPGK